MQKNHNVCHNANDDHDTTESIIKCTNGIASGTTVVGATSIKQFGKIISVSSKMVTKNDNKAGASNDENLANDDVHSEVSSTEETIHRTKQRKNLTAKKRKKTKEEVALLEAYFAEDPSWSRKTVKALKPQLPLSVDQIYKWGYDRKKLLKKRTAQSKAKKALCTPAAAPVVEPVVDAKAISDFNQEVDDLCRFNTGHSEALLDEPFVDESPQKPHRMLKDCAPLESFHSKETLPTRGSAHFAVIEDDPFFYDLKEEAVFYVSLDKAPERPHRRAGRRGLFRVPSGFVNMDFYTYKEEAFQDCEGRFLGELYKQE